MSYNKQRYMQNREKILKQRKEYRAKNRDKVLAQKKAYRERCSEHILAYQKEYEAKHKEQYRGYKRKYIVNNLEKVHAQAKINRKKPERRAQERAYSQHRRKTNIQAHLAGNLRARLWSAIKNKQKVGSAVRDLGCSIDEFKLYIEKLFKHGMSWDNYGLYGWHLDHIKPLIDYDLTDRPQFLEACHYTNIQPLWAEENLKKGAKEGLVPDIICIATTGTQEEHITHTEVGMASNPS